MNMGGLRRTLAVIICVGLPLHLAVCAAGAPLIVPDNSRGTADMPPPRAEYRSPDEVMMIIDGLPPGTTIELEPLLHDFTGAGEVPGGTLGGTVATFDAQLQWNIKGTGALAGFNRLIALPVGGEWHTAPRTPGDAVQSFDADVFKMQGDLFGDPDFDKLAFTAGTGFGLPGPGHTTLTKLPGGDFSVDSFFDITYEISFVGSPGSLFEDRAGATQGTIRMQAGEPVPEPSSVVLLLSGVIALLAYARRRREYLGSAQK